MVRSDTLSIPGPHLLPNVGFQQFQPQQPAYTPSFCFLAQFEWKSGERYERQAERLPKQPFAAELGCAIQQWHNHVPGRTETEAVNDGG